MNILHFVTTSIRSRYFEGIADHHDRKRLTLTVGTLDVGGPLHAELAARGIESFALDCQARSRYPIAVLRLVRFMRRHSIQVLQTHLVDAGLIGMIAGKLARGPLLVLTRHHADAVSLLRKCLPTWVDRLCAKLADRIIVPSQAVAEVLCGIEGVEPRKVSVIPYGFDFSLLKAAPRAAERVRKEFSLNGHTVIGVIGRLERLKGHQVFLQALQKMLTETSNLRALLVGEGPERANLKRLARELRISERVIFAGSRRDVPDLIAAMDLVAHPSLSEAFPQVLVEALALGKPVVASRVGGALEIIQDGTTGLLVPAGDATALGAALSELLRRPDYAKVLGERGKVEVTARFPIREMCAAYESCYEQWTRA